MLFIYIYINDDLYSKSNFYMSEQILNLPLSLFLLFLYYFVLPENKGCMIFKKILKILIILIMMKITRNTGLRMIIIKNINNNKLK